MFNNRAEADPTVGRVFWAGEWPGTLAGVSWTVGSGFPHASHLAPGRETPATPQNQEHVNFGFVQHQRVSDPWVTETGGCGGARWGSRAAWTHWTRRLLLAPGAVDAPNLCL